MELSRSHSLRSPRRHKDLRSTAILRSASGTKLAAMNSSSEESEFVNNSEKGPKPGVPVASLSVRRDSFNMNQGTELFC